MIGTLRTCGRCGSSSGLADDLHHIPVLPPGCIRTSISRWNVIAGRAVSCWAVEAVYWPSGETQWGESILACGERTLNDTECSVVADLMTKLDLEYDNSG